ncbi:MAG: hypothetical protein PHQ50_07410 [Eubacteriales bacterium]|nr:hypothetical protein [Eubacteriales bacterium]
MKKNVAIFLLVLVIVGVSGCTKTPPVVEKNELIVYQETQTSEEGLVHGECIIRWEQGKMSSMRILATYDSEESSKIAYEGLVAQESEWPSNVKLDGEQLSYDMNFEEWKDYSYEEMRNTFIEDGQWTIKE